MEDDIRASETKWVAKNIFAFVPFIGWVHWLIGMYLISSINYNLFKIIDIRQTTNYSFLIFILGDLFLKQSWEKDGAHIKEWLAQFKERHFKHILSCFPLLFLILYLFLFLYFIFYTLYFIFD